MVSLLQEELSRLYRPPSDTLWDRTPNEWLKRLGTREASEVITRLACRLFGGSKVDDPEVGYKVKTSAARIEVRLATLGRMGGALALMWQRVSFPGPSTHLCLVAVYPDNVRVFLVPQEDLSTEALSTIKDSPGKFQLTTKRVDTFWPWLVRHEIKGAL